MSYQEKNIAVSLMSTLLVFGYYFLNIVGMSQEGDLNATAVFSLWATIIVLTILVNIVASILTQITFNVIQKMRGAEEDELMEDERDKLIDLKGTRAAFLVFGIGVFVSMASLVINMQVLVMFNLLIVAGLASQVVGDLSRLYFYRRGF